jgi:CRISPR/Cas system-associated endonuclease Cas1
VEHYLDPAKRLYLARQFVEGSLFHVRCNLAYYQRRGRDRGSVNSYVNVQTAIFFPVTSMSSSYRAPA